MNIMTSCDRSSSNKSYRSWINSLFWRKAAAYELCCSACNV